jgi:hypothetical protein
MAWNVGNTDVFGCFKSKLCDPTAAKDVFSLVDKYQPDVILFSELCDYNQLMNTSTGCSSTPSGPVVDSAIYDAICSPIGEHGNHECVVWKKNLFKLVSSDYLTFPNCNTDFTVVRASLKALNASNPRSNIFHAVTTHPPSWASAIFQPSCSLTKNAHAIWSWLNNSVSFNDNIIIGGDWNEKYDVINPTIQPQIWQIVYAAYKNGIYWNQNQKTDVVTGGGYFSRYYDHLFANFGTKSTNTFVLGTAVGSNLDPNRIPLPPYFDHSFMLTDISL